MIKNILAGVWVVLAIAALILGFQGSIDPTAMTVFSIGALAVFYGFAVRAGIMNARDVVRAKRAAN